MRHLLKSLLKRGADFYSLEREIQVLREQVQWLRERLDPKSRGAGVYDLVRLDDISLFVPMYDNLYEHFIPPASKGLTLDRHRKMEQARNGSHRRAAPRRRYKASAALSEHPVSPWRAGAFFRHRRMGWRRRHSPGEIRQIARRQFFAECYDPSFSGTLIPFNIELNGVSEQVAFRPLGISLSGGPQIFSQIPGHSDAAKLGSASGTGPAETYLIHTRTLDECLAAARDRHAMVKIDVEGIDAKLVLQNLDQLRNATLMIEFAPSRDDSSAAFVKH